MLKMQKRVSVAKLKIFGASFASKLKIKKLLITSNSRLTAKRQYRKSVSKNAFNEFKLLQKAR